MSLREGRRAEARDRHARYYAQHPESKDRKLRRKGWEHFVHAESGIRFRLVDATTLNFRLPRLAALSTSPLYQTLTSGNSLLLAASSRLQSRLPEIYFLRVVITAVGPVTSARQKTGHVKIEEIANPALVESITTE